MFAHADHRKQHALPFIYISLSKAAAGAHRYGYGASSRVLCIVDVCGYVRGYMGVCLMCSG